VSVSNAGALPSFAYKGRRNLRYGLCQRCGRIAEQIGTLSLCVKDDVPVSLSNLDAPAIKLRVTTKASILPLPFVHFVHHDVQPPLRLRIFHQPRRMIPSCKVTWLLRFV
jgi:hypothetical protein